MKNTGGKSEYQILRQMTAELIIAKEEKAELADELVIAKEEKNAYDVSLEFFIGNNTQPTEISLMLKRTR